MKDNYSLFIEYSSMLCRKDGYADHHKVKTHNLAMTNLDVLCEEMKQNNVLYILQKLLTHGDDTVKLNAAAFCLKSELYCDDAIGVLKKIAKSSDDETLRFSAKMLLKGN